MTYTPIGFQSGQWLNPPAVSQQSDTTLTIVTDANTDFWRRTHYGFERSNGHALLVDMPATFAAEVTFRGKFRSKYEQAGFLLWEDETRWIKAGVEYADGRANLAVVVTRERSDWSMAPAAPGAEEFTIRLTATGSAVIIHARVGDRWQILRVADFDLSAPRLGPMACSPQGQGLEVTFEAFRLAPPPEDPLYLGS